MDYSVYQLVKLVTHIGLRVMHPDMQTHKFAKFKIKKKKIAKF